jgi:predicted GH43/DUF377 family glycosyl hydrolase
MDLEYLLDKNILVNSRTFNPSIIFDLKNNTYSNKIILNGVKEFILSYRCCDYDPCSISRICIKTNNTIEYDEITNKIKIKFNETNKIFGVNDECLEDARFTILDDKLHLVYSLVDSINVIQYVTPYCNENEKINMLKGIELNVWEKNWVIFKKTNTDSIFIIYSFYPNYIVYEVEESKTLKKIKSSEFPYSICGRVAGGTSPIEINNKLYFFCHYRPDDSPQWAPIYNLSVIVLDNETMEIIGFCEDLLENIKIANNIIYCRGSLYIENLKTFIVSLGIDDRDIKLISLDLDSINSKLIKKKTM